MRISDSLSRRSTAETDNFVTLLQRTEKGPVLSKRPAPYFCLKCLILLDRDFQSRSLVKLLGPLVRLTESGIDLYLSFRCNFVTFIVKNLERIGIYVKDQVLRRPFFELDPLETDELKIPDLVLILKCFSIDLNYFTGLDGALVLNAYSDIKSVFARRS